MNGSEKEMLNIIISDGSSKEQERTSLDSRKEDIKDTDTVDSHKEVILETQSFDSSKDQMIEITVNTGSEKEFEKVSAKILNLKKSKQSFINEVTYRIAWINLLAPDLEKKIIIQLHSGVALERNYIISEVWDQDLVLERRIAISKAMVQTLDQGKSISQKIC